MQGFFALTNKQLVNPTTPYRPFILLPRHTIFGDYQILFDLYVNYDFRTYVTIKEEEHLIANYSEEDISESGEYVVMMVDASKLL